MKQIQRLQASGGWKLHKEGTLVLCNVKYFKEHLKHSETLEVF